MSSVGGLLFGVTMVWMNNGQGHIEAPALEPVLKIIGHGSSAFILLSIFGFGLGFGVPLGYKLWRVLKLQYERGKVETLVD